MNYCSQCGARVTLRIPEGDSLPRHVCDACGAIHYQNPRMIVGCIPEWDDRILLCRRAIEPRHGLWTVPAGFMENGETMANGAAREALEEAVARVEIGPLYAMYNIPHINQVYVLFRARLLNGDFRAGAETLAAADVFSDEVYKPMLLNLMKRSNDPDVPRQPGDEVLRPGLTNEGQKNLRPPTRRMGQVQIRPG